MQREAWCLRHSRYVRPLEGIRNVLSEGRDMPLVHNQPQNVGNNFWWCNCIYHNQIGFYTIKSFLSHIACEGHSRHRERTNISCEEWLIVPCGVLVFTSNAMWLQKSCLSRQRIHLKEDSSPEWCVSILTFKHSIV